METADETSGAGIRNLPRVPAFGGSHLPGRIERHWPVLVLLAGHWFPFQAVYFLLATLDRPDDLPTSFAAWLADLLRYMSQPVELAICAIGALVCFLIYAALGRFAASSLKVKIAAALLATLAASFIFALANTYELGSAWSRVRNDPIRSS